MKGALVGDCAGSFWENSYNKMVFPQWWVPSCHFTDDSICSLITMEWLLSGEHTVEAYGKLLKERTQPYLNRGFASKFRAWARDPESQAYGSWGNGSVMRVSPVALWAKTSQEAIHLAEISAMPTHNSPEAVRGAKTIAWALWHILEGASPERVLEGVEREFGYEVMGLNPDEWRPHALFDVSCKGTVPLALAIALKAESFDHGLSWCFSMGGDADTLGAVAGPFLEARFGIPEQHWINTVSRFKEHSVLFGWQSEFYDEVSKWKPSLIARITAEKPATGPVIPASTYKIFSTDML